MPGDPIDRLEEKIDKVLAMAYQLLPQVAGHESDINYLRSSTKRNEIQTARNDERIKGLSEDVDSVGKKIRDHVVDGTKHRSPNESLTDATVRWRFIAAACAAVVGIAATISAVAPILARALGLQ